MSSYVFVKSAAGEYVRDASAKCDSHRACLTGTLTATLHKSDNALHEYGIAGRHTHSPLDGGTIATVALPLP
jgi:hypothetical protein